MRLFQYFLSSIIVFLCTNAWAQYNVVPNEYIVKFKTSAAGQKTLKKISGKVAQKAVMGLGDVVAFEDLARNGQVVDELKSDTSVEYVEPNYILTKFSGGSYSQSLAPTQTTQAWAQMAAPASAPKTIVAVIDTGLDYNHELFVDSNAIWRNTSEIANNGIDDDFNGYVDDVSGWNFINNTNNYMDDGRHGTHVSGIVVGVGFDIFASPIPESKVKIMPLKFLDGSGSGTTANAVKAIYYAANMGAKVINNSWGGPAYSRALHDALTYAYQRSIVIVSAAGNSNSNNDTTPMYPANYTVPSNISVMATDDYDARASFSNYGVGTVTVAAPGYAIWSSVPGNGYDFLSGTSMAAPYVAGLAAHAMREATNLSAYQIKSIIIGQVNTISALSTRNTSSGRVNALKTIQDTKTKTGLSTWSPSYTPSYLQETSLSSTSPESGGKGGCGTVSAIAAKNLMNGSGGGSGGSSPVSGAVASILLLAPLAFWISLRSKLKVTESSPVRRQFQRYEYSSSVEICIDGIKHIAQTATIGLGGLSLKAPVEMAKNQIIRLKVQDVEVEAEVVWSTDQKSYGLKFSEINQAIAQMLNTMAPSLNPC